MIWMFFATNHIAYYRISLCVCVCAHCLLRCQNNHRKKWREREKLTKMWRRYRHLQQRLNVSSNKLQYPTINNNSYNERQRWQRERIVRKEKGECFLKILAASYIVESFALMPFFYPSLSCSALRVRTFGFSVSFCWWLLCAVSI